MTLGPFEVPSGSEISKRHCLFSHYFVSYNGAFNSEIVAHECASCLACIGSKSTVH